MNHRSLLPEDIQGSSYLLPFLTNQLCIGSKRKGTDTVSLEMSYSGNSLVSPVSGFHSSGILPETRKAQLVSTTDGSGFATKYISALSVFL